MKNIMKKEIPKEVETIYEWVDPARPYNFTFGPFLQLKDH